MAIVKNSDLKLTLVTNPHEACLDAYLAFVHECAMGGITAVQLRVKNKPKEFLTVLGTRLKALLVSFGIPLVVNDSLELALELEAQGVHLGQEDGCPQNARNLLGPDRYVGLSINTLSNLKQANKLPLTYVGIGAIFPTPSKSDVSTIWGLEGLKKIASLSLHPVVAIGGIHEENAPHVLKAGACGIAAIGAFHEGDCPRSTAQNLRKIIDRMER